MHFVTERRKTSFTAIYVTISAAESFSGNNILRRKNTRTTLDWKFHKYLTITLAVNMNAHKICNTISVNAASPTSTYKASIAIKRHVGMENRIRKKPSLEE